MQHTSLNAENLPVPTVSKNNKLETNRKFNNVIFVSSPKVTTAVVEKNCLLHVMQSILKFLLYSSVNTFISTRHCIKDTILILCILCLLLKQDHH